MLLSSLAINVAIVVVVLLLATAVFLSYVVLRTYLMHLHWKREGLPCAPFIPLVGHILRVAVYHREDRVLDVFRERLAMYGDLYSLTFGPSSRLSVNSPPHIADVLRLKADCYVKGFINQLFVGNITGTENLLLTEGAEHSKHRRMINPAFHHHNLQEMVQLMVLETDDHIADWMARMHTTATTTTTTATTATATTDSADPFVQLDLHRELSGLTLAVIARCAFGTSGRSDTKLVYDAFESILKWTQWRVSHLVEFVPGLRDLHLLHKTEVLNGKQSIEALAERVIKERKEGKTGKVKGARQDLLDLLLEAVDPTTGDKLTDVEVRDEAMTFVLAGHETTANLMSWMLHVCMLRPQLWDELRAEADTVCGDEPLSHSHLTNLPILDAVINETLRFFPPIPIMQREVSKAHVLGSQTDRPVNMPVGALLQIELNIVHRLPQYWGDRADTFDHTRWLYGTAGKRPFSHPYAYLPFSSGVRNCIGMNFAQLEAKVIMVRVLQRTRMEWVAGQKMGADGWAIQQPIVTLRPKYGMQVRIYSRTEKPQQRSEQLQEEAKAG